MFRSIMGEQNIIDERPIVALQLKAAMSSYLEAIDAENLDEVYQARFSELDRFEVNARKVHQQRIERAKGDQKLINQADQKLELDLAVSNRTAECLTKMQETEF